MTEYVARSGWRSSSQKVDSEFRLLPREAGPSAKETAQERQLADFGSTVQCACMYEYRLTT